MKLHVRNYRGIERADLDLSGVAIVVGPNGSGKTSLAEGFKACLTGAPIVVHPEVEKIPQKSATELVRDGKDKGYVMLQVDEAASFEINYPSCKSKSKGQPAHASEVACGSDEASLPKLRPQFRAPALAELIEANPSLADLVNYLVDAGLNIEPKQAEQIWKIIEAKDWEGAHKQARDKGLELKGQYAEASGGTGWTKEHASEWRPEGYDPEWDGQTRVLFDDAVKAAQDHYDEVIGKGFVEASERQSLEAAAAQLNERTSKLSGLKHDLAVAEEALADVQNRHDETLPADIFWREPCPHCGAEIVGVRPVAGAGAGQLELRKSEDLEDPLTQDELKKRRVAIASIEGEISNKRGAIQAIKGQMHAAELALSDSTSARDRLAGLGAPATAKQEKARQGAAAIIERAHQNLLIFQAHRRSMSIDGAIKRNRTLCDSLAPTGVRQMMMAAKLEPFNARVSDVSAMMGILPVKIDDELLIWMGDRPYRTCSESEKFRIRIALQIAWALEDNSDAVVIDNDVDMDAPYYNSLVSTLCHYKLSALLSIRIDKRDKSPQLESAPDGVTGVVYWLQDGKALEISRKEA